MSVNKQINDQCGTVKEFHFSSPKTRSSIRTIPLTKVLLDDLKSLKEETSKIHGYNNDFFVCGDAFLISSNTLSDHIKKYATITNLHQIRLHDFRHSCASLLIKELI